MPKFVKSQNLEYVSRHFEVATAIVADDPEDPRVAAIVSDEKLADMLLAYLNDGVIVEINLEGGIVQEYAANVDHVNVIVVDWEVDSDEDDHTYAALSADSTKPAGSKGSTTEPYDLHAWVYEPPGHVNYPDGSEMSIICDVFYKGEDSPYYRPKPSVQVNTQERLAGIAWTVDDVLTKAQEKGIQMTEEEAYEFLQNSSSQIQNDTVQRGWDSIDVLLDMRETRLIDEREANQEAPAGNS